jgi:hypothetical protein
MDKIERMRFIVIAILIVYGLPIVVIGTLYELVKNGIIS